VKRSAADSKKRILDAAEAEFASKGFDGARLATIAEGAAVQQALIHHYFRDKAGLYREVIERALGAVSAEGKSILGRMPSPLPAAKIAELTFALAESLVRFCVEHGAVLAILRHDVDLGAELVGANIRPVFDGVVAIVEGLRRRGKVRKDLDARHLCLSALGMAIVTTHEEHLLRALWPEADPRAPEFVAARTREIARTVLARLLP